MKHAENVASVAAAVTALTTLLCCVPVGFAAAVASAGLASVVSSHQRWFIVASLAMLGIGALQTIRLRRACARRPTSSFIVLGVSTIVVLLVVLFPQVLATILADWGP